MSAGEIHKKVPDIDLVTVYRNLDLFVKEKMVVKVHLKDDEVQYEYQEKPHHHAVCGKCKKVIHFDVSDDKIKKILGLNNFDVEEIDLVVKGKCQKG